MKKKPDQISLRSIFSELAVPDDGDHTTNRKAFKHPGN
jgi:hypothetical protein